MVVEHIKISLKIILPIVRNSLWFSYTETITPPLKGQSKNKQKAVKHSTPGGDVETKSVIGAIRPALETVKEWIWRIEVGYIA